MPCSPPAAASNANRRELKGGSSILHVRQIAKKVTTAVSTVTGVSSFLCAAAYELATAAKSRSERAKPVAVTTVLTEAVKHEAAIAASQKR